MANKEEFIKTLQLVRANSPKRKFAQSIDLIFNLKDLDLKKPEEQLDVWVPLVHARGKPVRIAALVGPEMQEQAKANCDTVILHDDFKKYEGKKKEIKKLAKTNDFFIAQANIMPDVAKFFGRVLGPRGKMPNPKAGCVVPPNANLKALTEKLRKMLHIVAKTQLSAKCSIGKEDMKDEQLIENIMAVYNAVIHGLPQETNNIKSIMLKLSMGPVFKVGATTEENTRKNKLTNTVASKEAPSENTPERKTENEKKAQKEKPKKTSKAKNSEAAEVKQ
ncbi:MAG: 50S ribosomal protein L1 [Candidatus Woesearchaeota archaeon]